MSDAVRHQEATVQMIPAEQIRRQVREHYARRIRGGACCGSTDGATSCCSPSETETLEHFAGPNLGCGSPLDVAQVQPGETVVDLGSGAGREVLLAARQAGPLGRAIGIDMTPEMVRRARENARRTGIANAEFSLGEIEAIPLPDAGADVVVSNCVINLVPDKTAAFREAFRVLKPGGRLVVSDIVSRGPLPESLRSAAGAWAACVAGAMDLKEYLETIRSAGFRDVEVLQPSGSGIPPLFSATIRATKPA